MGVLFTSRLIESVSHECSDLRSIDFLYWFTGSFTGRLNESVPHEDGDVGIGKCRTHMGDPCFLDIGYWILNTEYWI